MFFGPGRDSSSDRELRYLYFSFNSYPNAMFFRPGPVLDSGRELLVLWGLRETGKPEAGREKNLRSSF